MGKILLIVIVVAIAWAIITYNRLASLRNMVQNAWQQIDVQLKRRHDLIPNLVAAVKGALEFEQDTLTKVMEARNRAVAATSPKDSAEAEGLLTQSLRQLFAVAENYPTLKSNENVLHLQEELTTTENQIGFARQFYNDTVMRFNTLQQVFPANLIAAQFAFRPAEYFNIPETERATPQVNLSLRSQ